MATRALITDAELGEWRRVYPTGGAAAVQALFPHRSKNCINVTAHRRGIKIADLSAFKLKHMRGIAMCRRHCIGMWNDTELAVMRGMYAELGPRKIMKLLPGRSYGAICGVASRLSMSKPHSPVLRRIRASEIAAVSA
jgi:hypothetical protein